MPEYKLTTTYAIERFAEREGFTAAMLGRHQKTNPYFEAGVMCDGSQMCLWRAWLRGWSNFHLRTDQFPLGVQELYAEHFFSGTEQFLKARIARDFTKFQHEHDGPIERRTCMRVGILPDWLIDELARRYGSLSSY